MLCDMLHRHPRSPVIPLQNTSMPAGKQYPTEQPLVPAVMQRMLAESGVGSSSLFLYFSMFSYCRAFPLGILPASCGDFGLVFGKWGVESGASRKQLAGGTRALQMVNLPAFM